MPAEFLNKLAISDEERAKLGQFGASTALALLSMRKASKEAFDNYLGFDRADEIAWELEKQLTPEEAKSLNVPPKGAGRLGARLDPPPNRPKS